MSDERDEGQSEPLPWHMPALWVFVAGAYGVPFVSGGGEMSADAAMEMRSRLDARIRAVEIRVARIPQEIPPPVVSRALTDIDRRLDVIEQRLAKIEP